MEGRGSVFQLYSKYHVFYLLMCTNSITVRVGIVGVRVGKWDKWHVSHVDSSQGVVVLIQVRRKQVNTNYLRKDLDIPQSTEEKVRQVAISLGIVSG
jgi:hypothetical protein